MKKWITVDALIVAFISAVAYGFGFSIPNGLGASDLLCTVLSFAVGLSVESIAEKIMYSKFTQEKRSGKFLVFAAFIAIFVICELISRKLFGNSLFENLQEEIGYVVIFSVLGFAVSLGKHYYKTVKAKKDTATVKKVSASMRRKKHILKV